MQLRVSLNLDTATRKDNKSTSMQVPALCSRGRCIEGLQSHSLNRALARQRNARAPTRMPVDPHLKDRTLV